MPIQTIRAERRVLKKAVGDVELVKRHARVVVKIPQTSAVQVSLNEEGALGVVAIIGPGRVCGEDLPEALLGEIGLGPNRPLKRVRKYKKGSHTVLYEFPKRFPGVNSLLTFEQCLVVNKTLFTLLREWADICVARWKRGDGNPFLLCAFRTFWSKKTKQFETRKVMMTSPGGITVAIPLTPLCDIRDKGENEKGLLTLFAQDVFRADIERTGPSLRSLANLLRFFLRDYARRGYRGSFETLKGAERVKKALAHPRQWLFYHQVRALQLTAKGGRPYPLFQELADLIGWNPAAGLPSELLLAQMAPPNFLERVGNLELRVRRVYPGNYAVVFVATSASSEKIRNGNGNLPLPSSLREENFPNGYPPSWDDV
ncbi:MAG: hypothetical protein HYU35_01890 [Parcubacteria group bacterium]|nr:hypothetical protein [Parcubacteria group bacterium]